MADWATIGEMIVSGGMAAPLLIPQEQLVLAQDQGHPAPQFTTLDRHAADTVFAMPPTAASTPAEPSLAAAALVIAAGTLSLKAVVVDESGILEEREEEAPPAPKRSKNQDRTPFDD